jgi:hypothetical protein
VTSAGGGHTPEEVRTWISVTEAEVAALAVSSEEIQTRLAQARKRLVLYHEILAALTKAPVAVSDKELQVARSIRERTIQSAIEILRAHGRPLRVQDLHAEFIRRGHPLPGRGTPTNIVVHLASSPLIERRGRGVYGLSEWQESREAFDESSIPSETVAR